MYTLTRKLSVICLTVVLSFLVYGCGGSSKQALITDVTDMVTAGLMPDPGTYTIGPGGTANAGDVTFACPAGGPTCKITVASDGTIMSVEGSAEGMATAMDSDFAIAKAERDAAEAARMVAEGERDAANMAVTVAEDERDAANMAVTVAEDERDAANMAVTVAQDERDAANMAVTVAQDERDAANMAVTVAEDERDAANMALTVAEDERDAAVTDTDAANMAVTVAQDERDAANMAVTVAQDERDAANMAVTVAEDERDAAKMAVTVAEDERDAANMAVTVAEGERDDALLAQAAAEKEARLLTTVTPIKPELAPDFNRVGTTDIYKVEPGETKVVPNSDVEINCPLEGGIRCTVVVAVNDDGTATYTSLGGVATVANTGVALHTRMAIALFSPDDEGMARDSGGLNAETDAAADGPPTDEIGVARSVDGRTTTFTLTHNAAEAADHEDNKYTSDEPVDIGHRITNWIGQTLKRDNGDEDSTASREDEGTFYTNINKAEPGRWKVSGSEVLLATYAFVIDPDQVISTEDGATFTGTYITEDGDIPGTYTCANTDDVCNDPGTPVTSQETGNLILNVQLDANWKFESDKDVKKGNVADKDYMYFGYWLQMPVKQSDDPGAYEFRAYSGGTGDDANLFSVDNALLDGTDGYTAVYKGGAAGRYVTRNLQFKDEVADPLSPGFHGRFTATAELQAYFGQVSKFEAEGDLPDRRNMLGGSIKEFKDGDRKLDFEVTLTPQLMNDGLGMDVIEGTSDANFGGDVSGSWSANFYGPNAAETNEVATNNTLPSGVAGQFDASSKYTKVIGAFAAEKQ